MRSWKGAWLTANLVSKDARDFKEKSHETARRDLLALRTSRAKRGGGGGFRPPPPAFLGLIVQILFIFKEVNFSERRSEEVMFLLTLSV